MKKDLWAVMCGTIRDELDFKLTLTKLIELRNQNKIQHILLSTWKGEIDKYENLRSVLNNLKIILVESFPISDELQNSGTDSVNYWRQARQLLSALDIIPSDSFILRLRTDRSLNYINQMESLGIFDAENYQVEAISYGKFPKIFNYKIFVFAPKMVRLMHMIDFVFLGHHKDLYKLLNFDVNELMFQKQIVANAQWFMKPFIEEFPVLRSYMRFTVFSNTIKVLKNYVDEHKDNSIFPIIYYKVYALYILIMHTHFKILYMGIIDDATLKNTSFYQFFSTSPNNNLFSTGLGTSIRNEKVLEYAIQGKLLPSESYSSFLEQVNKIVALGNSSDFEFTYEDLVDFEKFVNSKVVCDNEEIRWYKKLRTKPMNPKIADDEKHDPIILNCLNGEDEIWKSLMNTFSIEKDLFNKWVEIDYPSIQTTELMLLPAAKTGNEYAIYVLLDLYYKGKISALNVDEVIRITEFYLNIHVNKKTNSLVTMLIAYKYKQCVDIELFLKPRIEIIKLFSVVFEKYAQNINNPELSLFVNTVRNLNINIVDCKDNYYFNLILDDYDEKLSSKYIENYAENSIENKIRLKKYLPLEH